MPSASQAARIARSVMGQVWHDQAGRAGARGAARELLGAAGHYHVRVDHQHHRQPLRDPLADLEDAVRGGAVRQRLRVPAA